VSRVLLLLAVGRVVTPLRLAGERDRRGTFFQVRRALSVVLLSRPLAPLRKPSPRAPWSLFDGQPKGLRRRAPCVAPPRYSPHHERRAGRRGGSCDSCGCLLSLLFSSLYLPCAWATLSLLSSFVRAAVGGSPRVYRYLSVRLGEPCSSRCGGHGRLRSGARALVCRLPSADCAAASARSRGGRPSSHLSSLQKLVTGREMNPCHTKRRGRPTQDALEEEEATNQKKKNGARRAPPSPSPSPPPTPPPVLTPAAAPF
jgi:hypothetical protein